MLQRAASSAYSWWVASNIRTKQSKWLDSDVEEMETRVKSMINIVEHDGDSFAKKAELYFKRRPELIEIIEETYKSYKALADRFDHISTELHKANHTLATAFPDQIHFDDDDDMPKAFTKIDASKLRKTPADLPSTGLSNKIKDNQAGLKKSRLARVISQNSKDKAQEEIDKLQKGILALQTEKEYIKSTYETGMTKYWDIEKRITDMQDEVFCLQDAFNASVEIEDDDARALMAMTALKSCEKTLSKLEQEQKRSAEEAKIGSERIMVSKEKLKAVMGISGELEEIEEIIDENSSSDEEGSSQNEEGPDSDDVIEPVEISSETSVVELAEKINDLVTKIIDMDLTATSQTAQIKSLRSETDMLQRHVKRFEKEKKSFTQESDSLHAESNSLREETNTLHDRLKEAEEKLLRAQEFEQQVQNERSMAAKGLHEETNTLHDRLREAEEKLSRAQEFEQQVQSERNMAAEILHDESNILHEETNTLRDQLKEAEERLLQAKEFEQQVQNERIMAAKDLLEESNSLRAERNILLEETNTLRDRLKEADEKLLRAREFEQQVLNERSMAAKGSIVFSDTPDDTSVEPVPPKPQDQINLTGLTREATCHVSSEAATMSEKEAKETIEPDQDGIGELHNSSVESSVYVEDMSSKHLDQIDFSGLSQDVVNENELKDSGNNGFTEASDTMNSAGEQSPGVQEGGPGLTEQTVSDHSQAGSQLKDGQSLAAKHEVEISPSKEFYDINLSQESKQLNKKRSGHLEGGSRQLIKKRSGHLEEGSKDKDDGAEKSKLAKQELEITSSEGDDSILQSSSPELEDQLKCLRSLVDKLEGKEKVILADYTSVLQSYEDMKRRLSEAEKKNEVDLLRTKELQNANDMKDQEIHSLRKSLRSARSPSVHNADVPSLSPQSSPNVPNHAAPKETMKPTARRFQSFDVSDRKAFANKDIKPPAADGRHATIIEEKFRREIDTVLQENLEFWLRYSISFHGIENFEKSFKELEAEIKKLKPRKLADSPLKKANNQDTLPIDKKLRDLKTDLQVWLEQNTMLQEELEGRFSSIATIQEDISGTLEASLEASLEPDVVKFAPYQAAKLQGELLNMQLENNKVAEELKAGLDHIRTMHSEVQKALSKLHGRFELPKLDGGSSQLKQFKQLPNKHKVPLKSFLFVPKPKKKTILNCVNPALNKHIPHPQKKTVTPSRPS